ncbi:ATPase, T2SS/T4P/T4SS family [Romboutsia sedimentorum]|uniref:ATPase, T2SS/T4P/T4SS family n=1 Tax=Romboutsia sedimentorum TaxID=1368474 RepID=A0ABT7ECW6_9FIRM|nr:ATPase, T2SS/T4P/T4SS family [Romboutsia sedimentorum]MDK2564763.1 ATPase, T2SS/T4P/T4SS family [Romboutsia sedimentorum]
MLENAVRMRASDIHVEHEGDFRKIRFRIDGMFIQYMKTSVKSYKAVVSRIKIIAKEINKIINSLKRGGSISEVMLNEDSKFAKLLGLLCLCDFLERWTYLHQLDIHYYKVLIV